MYSRSTVSLILVACLACASCATTVSEHMLADGNTWSVKVNAIGKCNGYSSNETCISGIKPLVETRATELCGKSPQRVFACGKSGDDGMVGVRCNVQCDEAKTVKVRGPAEGLDAVQTVPKKLNQDVVKKAKRCQEKGGVWVNDSCQIDVEAH